MPSSLHTHHLIRRDSVTISKFTEVQRVYTPRISESRYIIYAFVHLVPGAVFRPESTTVKRLKVPPFVELVLQ